MQTPLALLGRRPLSEARETKNSQITRVLSVDPDKVDDALDVTDLREEDIYDIDERAYVWKAEVGEDVKEIRLQGLKEQLVASESEEARSYVTKSKLSKPEPRISPALIQHKSSTQIRRLIDDAFVHR